MTDETKPLILDDVRKIIDDQRSRLPEDRRFNAPVIVHHLLDRTDEFVRNRPVLLSVLSPGWSQHVRLALHRPTELPSAEQLDMWPQRLRDLVLEVGHRALHVPSRGRMLALVPGEMTPAELREAGEFLVSKGRETMARGRACLRLADVIDARPLQS